MGLILPYKKGVVVATKVDPKNPKKLSKAEMVEAILFIYGVGKEAVK